MSGRIAAPSRRTASRGTSTVHVIDERGIATMPRWIRAPTNRTGSGEMAPCSAPHVVSRRASGKAPRSGRATGSGRSGAPRPPTPARPRMAASDAESPDRRTAPGAGWRRAVRARRQVAVRQRPPTSGLGRTDRPQRAHAHASTTLNTSRTSAIVGHAAPTPARVAAPRASSTAASRVATDRLEHEVAPLLDAVGEEAPGRQACRRGSPRVRWPARRRRSRAGRRLGTGAPAEPRTARNGTRSDATRRAVCAAGDDDTLERDCAPSPARRRRSTTSSPRGTPPSRHAAGATRHPGRRHPW